MISAPYESYKLNKVIVRMYNDVRYLCVSSSTTVTPIDDIGEVSEPQILNCSQTMTIVSSSDQW